METRPFSVQRLKELVIGGARSPQDPHMFHKLSLVAFFAWVGLGADGLSSSCYGPPEAFLVLKAHIYLGMFVALGTAVTVLVISASYSQIIELFPTGGGGYLVASKLLSPRFGMLSGCALLIDYVLTITISIASGADALFSLLPQWHALRLPAAVIGVAVLTLMNLRGVKESVVPLVPIFVTFVLTHVFAILYAVFTHLGEFPAVAARTAADVRSVTSEAGFLGLLFLILRSYSMGAGTYTGIEAVSNGIPILREPKAQTAKRTMRYMAISLAFTALGLMLAYVLYEVSSDTAARQNKTLNAVLFDTITAGWGSHAGYVFVLVTLVSEAAILFVAAQTGFLDGPRVLSNMSLDRWFPSRFGMLSDRLVTQDGILLMGGAAIVLMALTGGSVGFLVVLYSINVFITFLLSQTGMVRHWWIVRSAERKWLRKLLVNGVGLVMTAVILVSVVALKFGEGGWITLVITGALVTLAVLIRRHYDHVLRLLRRLDDLVLGADAQALPETAPAGKPAPPFDPYAKTAVILVSGFNGLGLHTLAAVLRLFGGTFKNFVFIEVGVVDAGNFKGAAEVDHLKGHVQSQLNRYINYMRQAGYYAEGFSSIGTDVVDEIVKLAPQILERFPQAIIFGGQLVFPEDSVLTRWLHNNAVFALQRRFYHQGIPFVILPIRVTVEDRPARVA